MYKIENVLSRTRIILASTSPRRKEILSYLNVPFEILSSGADETIDLKKDLDADEKVKAIAYRKLKSINHKNALVIAADTEVIFKNEILGKPIDASHAVQMLQKLSSQEHTVITAVAIQFPNGKRSEFIEKSKVVFDTIPHEDIAHYVHLGNPFDKAGGYGIQEAFGALFIRKIDGCFFNVMGFPLRSFQNFIFENIQNFSEGS